MGFSFLVPFGVYVIPIDKEEESTATVFVNCETDSHKDKSDMTVSDSTMTLKAVAPVKKSVGISGSNGERAQKDMEKVGDTSQIQTPTVLLHAKDPVEQPKKRVHRKNETYLPFPVIM